MATASRPSVRDVKATTRILGTPIKVDHGLYTSGGGDCPSGEISYFVASRSVDIQEDISCMQSILGVSNSLFESKLRG